MSKLKLFLSLLASIAPLMAERTLQQSREAEVAVADALVCFLTKLNLKSHLHIILE